MGLLETAVPTACPLAGEEEVLAEMEVWDQTMPEEAVEACTSPVVKQAEELGVQAEMHMVNTENQALKEMATVGMAC